MSRDWRQLFRSAVTEARHSHTSSDILASVCDEPGSARAVAREAAAPAARSQSCSDRGAAQVAQLQEMLPKLSGAGTSCSATALLG